MVDFVTESRRFNSLPVCRYNLWTVCTSTDFGATRNILHDSEVEPDKRRDSQEEAGKLQQMMEIIKVHRLVRRNASVIVCTEYDQKRVKQNQERCNALGPTLGQQHRYPCSRINSQAGRKYKMSTCRENKFKILTGNPSVSHE
jgi:hypothetical protein